MRYFVVLPRTYFSRLLLYQVAITIGASQALYVSFQAILSPGDEVILLEPFFDLYLGQIKMAGGLPRQVPLSIEEGEWRLDADALRRYLLRTNKWEILLREIFAGPPCSTNVGN